MNLPGWLQFRKRPVEASKCFTAADCPESQQVHFSLLSAVLPPEIFSVSAYSLILKNMVNRDWQEAADVIRNTGYEPPAAQARTFADLASEARLKFSSDLIGAVVSDFTYHRQGFHPDILNEFPAQRLIQVQFDLVEPVDWRTFWPANGGKFHGGEMVALKWDPVWWRISFLGLPVAPFQLGSGYDLEDVDRDEAEAFGLIKPRQRPPAVKIEFDLADLKSRLAVAVAARCS